jgi:hypothetical protein
LIGEKQIDQWGNGTTVEIERPCNAPTQVTLDWFDEAVTLPKQDAEGKGWDENIKPVKTTKVGLQCLTACVMT